MQLCRYPTLQSGRQKGPGEAQQTLLKGTVQRDFSTPVFFTKRLVLVSIDMPRSDFEFCQIFVELFVLKISKY
jgi:hypothetical protein